MVSSSLVAMLLISGAAMARVVDNSALIDCSPTPKLETTKYPGFKAIPSGNQLIQPAGKAEAVASPPIIVLGRVLDSACVPVADAKIELWQADSDGRYSVAKRDALASANPVFVGAGRATSNNEGQFSFTTLYPASATIRGKREDGTRYTAYRAPHLNVRISHDSLKTFSTSLFFEGEPENENDSRLKKLAEGKRPYLIMTMQPTPDAIAAGATALIDIVLPERQAFRKY